jgi:type IV pilus assembly protein PilA
LVKGFFRVFLGWDKKYLGMDFNIKKLFNNKGECEMLKKLMNKKKNNKGFSLVELIVVVLIIAIIAVALAPQVMKWVGTSKTNVDANNSSTIKASFSTAVADHLGKGGSISETVAYDIKSTGVVASSVAVNGALLTVIQEVVNGEYPRPQEDSNKIFHVVITASTGAVTVSKVTGTY